MRLAAAVVLSLPLVGAAAEIYSNGVGGGVWSDAATWRGGKCPAGQDTVVITSHDFVTYDGGESEDVDCAGLAIDPDGALVIKAAVPKRVLTVAGPIDTFGALRMDGVGSPGGAVCLRLTGSNEEARTIRVGKRGSLLIYGEPSLPMDQLNVRVTGLAGEGETPPPRVVVVAGNGAAIDWCNAAFDNLKATVSEIDNTGFEAGERINVNGCHFLGLSELAISSCDTPTVIGNRIDNPTYSLGAGALSAVYCTLPEFRGNTVIGRHYMGISIVHSADSMLVDNTIEGAVMGIYWVGTNAMGAGNVVRRCDIGMHLTSMSGLVQNSTVEHCLAGIQLQSSEAQLVDTRWVDQPEGARPLSLNQSSARFLNIPLKADDVVFGEKPAKGESPYAQSLCYLIVAVNGNRTLATRVTVRTEGVDPDKPDPNVRNAIAPILSNGLTPLPQSLMPIIVAAWSVGMDGVVTPSPRYVITAWEPAADADPPRKVLATATVQADSSWYRENPNAPVATVELTIP